MADSLQQTPAAGTDAAQPVQQFDAIIIGAGLTGLYQLYRLRELGLSARIFDDAAGVGGTWYWNRYPGARFDSESYTYGYSFSEELLQEWDWKEHFSGQPENERYLNYVADKFDLRRDIQLNSRVSSAVYDEGENRWEIQIEGGGRARAQFLIGAVGVLSAHYLPDFPGLESFQGDWCHTGRWPKEGMDLAGKRVGVVGTGATAIQLIPEIAKEVAHLTVFQRTPNYTAPLRNGEIDPETQQQIKSNYPEMFAKLKETSAAFIHDVDPRSCFEVTPEERLAKYEDLWAQRGFSKWMGNFQDTLTDDAANEDYAEFVRNKVRERVHDPVVAEMLIPKDYPFGAKRVPMETNYYEVYNRDNVLLVDVKKAPIESITPKGIKTQDAEYEFDVIIFATGFDGVTGSLTRMDIRGEGGQTIKDKFAGGPRTYLGIQSAGFPNFFIESSAVGCNFPRCAEFIVEWVSECIGQMRDKEYVRIEATREAEDAWAEQIERLSVGNIVTKGNSWFIGANIPGKARTILIYPDSAPNYRNHCTEVADNGYQGFKLQ
jgi:cation diffusion facilitator CzcD-associated flavoprotein CzcO